MQLTQGTFSHLPDLTDEEIAAQVAYAMNNGWAIALEFTDDPHPRNVYWEMWGLPMFDAGDPSVVLHEIDQARNTYPGRYLRLVAYDASYGRQTTALSFIVNRPLQEPNFHLGRQEASDRMIRYSLHPEPGDATPGDDDARDGRRP